MSQNDLRLGVNIDHVATVRNARGGAYPDPIRAAKLAEEAGADGITAHLREDRRHIRDGDIAKLKTEVALPLNFEMAATQEMLEIALKTKPNACCHTWQRISRLTLRSITPATLTTSSFAAANISAAWRPSFLP